MIEVSDIAQAAISNGFYRPVMAVDSFLGKKLLANDIPFVSGSEDSDLSQNVPERLTFTILRRIDGYDWSPSRDNHPLAARGQRLRVSLGIDLGHGEVEWFQRGWYVIYQTETDGDIVTVNAVGMLQWIQESIFPSPYQPIGSFEEVLRVILEPAITATVDPSLSTRNVPSNVVFTEDRLSALNTLLDAWPAVARMSPEGYLDVLPVPDRSDSPVATLSDGLNGTIIKATGSSSREGIYNFFIVRGDDADGTPFQSVVAGDNYGGPFNPLPVVQILESETIDSLSVARKSVQLLKERNNKKAAVTYTVEMYPNPTFELDDVLRITTADVTDKLVAIQAMKLPYMADGGNMTLTVRTL